MPDDVTPPPGALSLPGAMPGNLPEGARPPADFDPVALARRLLSEASTAALGTLDRNTGHPVTTLVTIAADAAGAPLLLLSRLSSHTANLERDARASLLVSQTGKGDPLAHPRLTALGRLTRIEDEARRAAARARFLERHPKAALYADFGDFGFFVMAVESGHLNGGFARAADLPGDVLVGQPR